MTFKPWFFATVFLQIPKYAIKAAGGGVYVFYGYNNTS